MSRIKELFAKKENNVLNVYCTAGYPELNSTVSVMRSLQQHGVDIIELGIPYSDPLADGPCYTSKWRQSFEQRHDHPCFIRSVKKF